MASKTIGFKRGRPCPPPSPLPGWGCSYEVNAIASLMVQFAPCKISSFPFTPQEAFGKSEEFMSSHVPGSRWLSQAQVYDWLRTDRLGQLAGHGGLSSKRGRLGASRSRIAADRAG